MLLEYQAKQQEEVDAESQHVGPTGLSNGKSEDPSDEQPQSDNDITVGEPTKQ
jgi:hypothetical protein